MFLGSHYVDLAVQSGLSYKTIQPLAISNVPETVRLFPLIAVAAAASYTSSQIKTRKIKHAISNALGAGMGYFLAGVGAVVLSDMRPEISSLLIIALLVGSSIWAGSAFIRTTTGGLPFIGITSLGTIAAVGILIILGGVAVASALKGLIAISFGVSGGVGLCVGMSRKLESRGKRQSRAFPRLYGLLDWGRQNWLESLIVILIIGTLAFGLTGGTLIQ